MLHTIQERIEVLNVIKKRVRKQRGVQ